TWTKNGFVDVSLSPSGELMAWLAAPTNEEPTGAVYIHKTGTNDLVRTVTKLPAPRTQRNKPDATFGHIRLLDEGRTLLLQQKEALAAWCWNPPVPATDGRERAHFFDGVPVSKPPSARRDDRPTRPLAVTPDGKTLVTDDFLGMTRWDIATGKKLG